MRSRVLHRSVPAAKVALVLLCLTFVACQPAAAQVFRDALELPHKGVSERVTQRVGVAPDSTITLFDEEGPGGLLHWWMTYSRRGETDRAHHLRLKMYYDGAAQPAVDVTLAQYFSILLGNDFYEIDNAAIKLLPNNAVNSYFPIPFESLRMDLTNEGEARTDIWFMGDWHRYADTLDLTPLRLRVVHRKEMPADSAGSYLMADLEGEGFLAGMTKAVRRRDYTDAWYHSGGDLVLLDGMTRPRALRGIGGEDTFNMSFGVWPVQTDWVGLAYRNREAGTAGEEPYEVVNYRVFGPAPIWFTSSAVVRFGSRANDLESVVYAYLASAPATAARTPSRWRMAGPFQTLSHAEFEEKEWAEEPVETWPDEQVAEFGVYRSNLRGKPQTATAFSVPKRARAEHGWVDFARHYRGRRLTNAGTQPTDVSAYAVGTLRVDEPGAYEIDVGYDDWLTLWINGERIHTGRHDAGFAQEQITRTLPAGEIEFRVKLSNRDNFQWRLWAFSFAVERQE